MDWPRIALTAVLLAAFAATVVGNFYFQRWNRQRGHRLAAEAEARGESLPNRNAVRIVLIAFAVILFVSGAWLLRG